MDRLQILRRVVFLALACMAGSGCRTSPPDAPADVAMTSTCSQSEAFAAALSALKALHFKIDKADSHTGTIQTRPLRGAQWFELWRRDNTTAHAFAEANLHSLRRTATVQIRAEGDEARVSCRVQCERLSVPSRTVTSSSQLYHILTDSEIMMQRLEFSEEQEGSMEWIDIGHDSALQNRILAGIERGLLADSAEVAETPSV